ncbi:hypothetical protein GH714_023888 [Hevea brasiliensis]|uniref:Uncharacterized protein n=1 Tax=Hevea brasiliensis TaxID=3981 RepID=A0A6A6LAS4_HEVBR|nr:hypothetical protein GH714_023888 [Hevea brasiliensis]
MSVPNLEGGDSAAGGDSGGVGGGLLAWFEVGGLSSLETSTERIVKPFEDDTVFGHDLDDDDDESSQSQDDDDDLENDDVMVENDDVLADEEDEEDLNSVSPSISSPATVPVAVPSASAVTIAVPNGVDPPCASVQSASDPKRQRVETTLATFEISRKIWSSTGQIGVVDGGLDDEEGNPNPNPNHPNFNDGEVKIEDQKPTPRSRKRSRSRPSAAAPSGVKVDDNRVSSEAFVVNNDSNNNNITNNNTSLNVSVVIEETVRSCLLPLFKELLSNVLAAGPCSGRGIGGLAMNAVPLTFGGGEMMVDGKWRKQQILELEVYSKRLELVQDQIRAQLEELRSMGG